MLRCWNETSSERPSFTAIAEEIEDILTVLVGYSDMNAENSNNVVYYDFARDGDDYDSENDDEEDDTEYGRKRSIGRKPSQVSCTDDTEYERKRDIQRKPSQLSYTDDNAYGIRMSIIST